MWLYTTERQTLDKSKALSLLDPEGAWVGSTSYTDPSVNCHILCGSFCKPRELPAASSVVTNQARFELEAIYQKKLSYDNDAFKLLSHEDLSWQGEKQQ